ncbi:MAG: hypothetical protein J6I64_07650, partial [Lachnospiraceae bacterium]|nr:hypothetical protein [Lachnospiraceae bacterium]
DARFNAKTYELFRLLMQWYIGIPHIYMSATFQGLDILLEKIEGSRYRELEQQAKDCRFEIGFPRLLKVGGYHTTHYKLDSNYGEQYRFFFFESWDNVGARFKSTDPSEKWLVFVRSMSETETVIKALGAPKKEDVVCLDAGKKDTSSAIKGMIIVVFYFIPLGGHARVTGDDPGIFRDPDPHEVGWKRTLVDSQMTTGIVGHTGGVSTADLTGHG